jgi:hypothetical protein
MPQEKHIEIYMDNLSVIVFAKNLVFHDRSNHIDTRFHYLRDCITNNKVEVKYIKIQDRVAEFSQSHSNIIFCQDKRYVRCYKEIKFKEGC